MGARVILVALPVSCIVFTVEGEDYQFLSEPYMTPFAFPWACRCRFGSVIEKQEYDEPATIKGRILKVNNDSELTYENNMPLKV